MIPSSKFSFPITRNCDCNMYANCLDAAARQNRKDFTCPEDCPLKKGGSTMTEPETTWIVEKFNDPDTKKLCTLCGLKPAILARRTGQPTHGLCHDCWYTKFKAGTVNAENRKKKLCKVPGCDVPAKARGFCGSHYDKWREHGIDGFSPFQTVKPDWRTKAVPETTKPKPAAKKSIFVNLNGYDILDDLADAAHTHMRPVEMQALAYIVAGLKNDGYGEKK